MIDVGELGGRIQHLRRERDMTLRALADGAAVSVSMLSAVERGQKAPTIVVLARIADGLGVALAGLVSLPGDRLIVRRAADQERIDEPGGWRRAILTPVVPGVNFEWISVTLPPGCDAGGFPAYAPGSHEFLVMQSGSLLLTAGERTVRLDAGDSAYFAADVGHGYANPGREPCTYSIAALIMRPRSARPLRPAAHPGRSGRPGNYLDG